MKNSIHGVLVGFMAASLVLTGCTNSDKDSASSAEPGPTANPVGEEQSSVARFEEHKKLIEDFDDPSEIVSQVESNGSVKLRIGDLPARYDSVGFMVSCTGTSEWEVQFSNGSSFGGSNCGDDVPGSTASISLPITQLTEEEAWLDIEGEVKVWATVFATNEPE